MNKRAYQSCAWNVYWVFDYGLVERCILRNFYGWYMNKVSFYSSFEKLEPQQKINFPTIKVFPKDTSFFSLPHARRRPFRRAIVAIWKDIKRTCAEYAVRAILRIYSAIETSLCRLKRKSFGIVVFLCRRLRSNPIHYQAIHTNETSILCASLRTGRDTFEFLCW